MQIKSLLKITLVFTLCVILMGAYTRLSDAGLGCPDWPGCYGMLKVPTEIHELNQVQQAFPEHTVETEKAWLEMIHRYIAGTLGLLVLLILVLSLKTDDAPKKLPMFIAALIIFQAALGMWTVTMKLMPIIVMAHLLGGFALFSLLLLLYLRSKPLRIPGGDPAARKLAGFAAICIGVLLLQIVLGGWTSSNYAALACTTLPLCEGNWVDNLSFAKAFSPFQGDHASFEYGVLDYPARMTIHVAHRVGAIITAAMLLYLAFKLITTAKSTTIRNAAWLLMALVFVQVGLGIGNVVLHLPLGIAVSHNAGAALLLLTLVFINYALWRKA
ncbi:COX15/CtaA family protein [Shewanella pealeana]|uniref:Cytochrome oxidase assembly n=1 Tax=Shewanella pealeana (strain ATCC 700345 / ANG-SQ1) TaxID=398579 RepID=A8H9S8_SHEPA|nr:COX15/CtaA family protein [Shewanella pealeana]ABV89315.1 cytochrome oxidase assembly [Shewanella pealeana ATCC 700345]